MSKRARLEATLAGEAVDRPAVSLWRHWPVDDQRGEDLARASLDFQRSYDFDFMKVTPSSSYCLAGYGAASTWQGNMEGTREYGQRVIQAPEHWTRLQVLDPQLGLPGQVLRALQIIGQAVKDEVPFIITIFNPLSQATYLAGERLLPDLRQHPEAVKAGLATITESILRFIDAARSTGIAGIFLALQHARYDLLTEAEYRDVCEPLDRKILTGAEGLWFNLVHLHGRNVMFDLAADYPAQALNWHDQETQPSLGQGLSRSSRALCGGLRQWETMVRGTPEMVRAEAQAAIEATGGRRFILGTGCVTPIVAPTANILAARKVVEIG